LTAIAIPFVLLFCGRQFFYFVFGLLLLDFINYVAFGEATLCYRILHASGMENAVGFVALVKQFTLICCFW
jgi:hypothetical protein